VPGRISRSASILAVRWLHRLHTRVHAPSEPQSRMCKCVNVCRSLPSVYNAADLLCEVFWQHFTGLNAVGCRGCQLPSAAAALPPLCRRSAAATAGGAAASRAGRQWQQCSHKVADWRTISSCIVIFKRDLDSGRLSASLSEARCCAAAGATAAAAAASHAAAGVSHAAAQHRMLEEGTCLHEPSPVASRRASEQVALAAKQSRQILPAGGARRAA
jgi:hypothetical protein